MYKKKKERPKFDCPNCGNPLFFTRKEIIICKYCNGRIKPQKKRPFQAAEVIPLKTH